MPIYVQRETRIPMASAPVMEVKVFNALRVQMSGKKSPSLLIDLYIAENSTVLIGFFGRRIHRMLLQQ